ncbi:MAG: hypothetical protein A2270_02830 [Elusimicrobia bacterium RIFOXYA12_FULL_51_18]|nr:MAG: hypothetical protein A2270_02830 [Elusimicrobia bacterium RIFOXYA12_FULL_51_18]OGS29232.1 MAG: hypothetical protein A2218_04675 [Elusimicrobia bacterium RIFOXYA2_FULL_53_38]
MSIKGSFKAECPSCKERFDADFWTVIRGDRDLQLKEALISGELDLLMCPACSNIFPCEETLIYMDPVKELLAFVMPAAYLAEKEKWLEKMRLDYEALKPSLVKENFLAFEPLYYFGAGMLSDLLLSDRDREEETEVMEFMAGEQGFKSAAIRPGFAREHDLPFSLPYAGCPCRDHALEAARAVSSANDALARIKNLIKLLEELKTQDLPFIKS